MDRIFEYLTHRLSTLGVAPELIDFEPTPRPELGDIAVPCFLFAKEMKRPPAEIARGLAAGFTPDDILTHVEAIGPYLNFTLAPAVWNAAAIKGVRSGVTRKRGDQIIVEFFHANTHKAVHIGHLRNLCLGSAIANLLEADGYEVVRVNYQGDIGPHVAKCLWALQKSGQKQPPFGLPPSLWLAQLYVEGHRQFEDDPKVAAEIREVNKKIYAGDPVLRRLWEETRAWCLEDFEILYHRFGVRFDRLYFESEVEERAQSLARELLERGVLCESQGAIIADLTDAGLDVLVIITGDGTPLYGAKDLALAELKTREYPKAHRSLHVVGHEQEFYFKQLLEIFKRGKFTLGDKSEHLVYALVRLPEGKMSSRGGTVVTYYDVWEKLFERALAEVEVRHGGRNEPVWDEKKRLHTAERIALAALRIGMLRSESNREIVFDWDEAMRLEGDTGPYLLYTYARIQSIFRKAGERDPRANLALLTSPEECLVIRSLAAFPRAISVATTARKPNLLVTALFDVAHAFNEFYHAQRVLEAESAELKKSRLMLCNAVAQTLERGLGLLGIEVVEEM